MEYRGIKRDKLNGTNRAEFAVFQIFADFLPVLGITAFRSADFRRKPQENADFRRKPQESADIRRNQICIVVHLVAPYCAIPRDYLSDTPLLRAMGAFGVST